MAKSGFPDQTGYNYKYIYIYFFCYIYFSSSVMKLHISPRNQSITKPKIGSCRTSEEHERRSEKLRRRKDRAEEEMRERERGHVG